MRSSDQNEGKLWKNFREGSDRAFFDLYDQYVDVLFSFGVQFCTDKEIVKDCIQDLFIDLYRYRKSLSDTDSIKFYLFRSLRRKLHKEISKNQFVSLDEEVEVMPDLQVSDSEKKIIGYESEKENLHILEQALKQLTKQQQRALAMKFEQNLSYSEIASLLNISVESARTNIYRALKSLRKKMSKKNIAATALLIVYYKSMSFGDSISI